MVSSVTYKSGLAKSKSGLVLSVSVGKQIK